MGMMRSSNALQDEPQVMMDINTTPLIDVMLVLLIMLIITIPIQLHAVNLEMPVNTPLHQKSDPVVIKVAVDANGGIYWNGRLVENRASLDVLLTQAKAMEPQPELHIASHAKAKYHIVAGVLASAQRLGLTKLGVVGSEQFANPSGFGSIAELP